MVGIKLKFRAENNCPSLYRVSHGLRRTGPLNLLPKNTIRPHRFQSTRDGRIGIWTVCSRFFSQPSAASLFITVKSCTPETERSEQINEKNKKSYERAQRLARAQKKRGGRTREAHKEEGSNKRAGKRVAGRFANNCLLLNPRAWKRRAYCIILLIFNGASNINIEISSGHWTLFA